jgi:ornithine cyclodeaminase/alanine dehydrogenase-like protein (mu-crystallin family)
MDGTSITGARTAACSALATRALAAVGSRVVAIVGTGVQARAHVDALRVVLPDARIVVAGRDAERAATFADAIGTDAAPSIEAAVQAADVVCVATHAEAPVLRREWLHAGAHVNSVGYNTTGTGEVDRHTVRDAYVVVESRASTLAPPPAGAVELRSALDDGAMSHDVAELGEVLSGERPGRTDAAQLTLYKSVGVAVQDAAAAMLVLADARSRGLGVEVAI